MSKNEIDTTWASEVYLHVDDLTDAEMNAIHALSGVHPGEYAGVYVEEEIDVKASDPRAEELMIFLANTIQLSRCHAFTVAQIAPISDLLTYAEYLTDAAHLMAKVDRPSMPVLIIASLAASVYIDRQNASDPGEAFESAWDDLQEQAQQLFRECLQLGMMI